MFIDPKADRGRPDLFTSAKTVAAIPARHPALRTALVRASLDPAVRAISHVQTAHVASAPVELDAVVLERTDGRFHLDVVPARRPDDEGRYRLRIALRKLGLVSLVVTADELCAEPMRTNCDLVWSYRGRAVAVDLRLQILRILVDDGPMALDRLLRGVVSGREPAAAVMSLACDDLLALDLESGPLGPSTVVRIRT